MSAPTDRRVCSRCGANNFATQAACWKCGAPLAAGGPSPAPASPPMTSPAATTAPGFSAAAPARSVDPAVAIWAAVALAFFFPFLAVPVGLVFLMLDDRRRAELGKIALIWGVIFSVLHLLLTWWMLAAAIGQLRNVSPALLGGQERPVRLEERRQSAPPPAPDTPVPPLQLPGIGP